jgi:CheY-like chemotaxis protein
MADAAFRSEPARCILVVEDEYLIAMELAESLERLGFEVVGPAGSIEEALWLIEENGNRLTVALLDINVRNERVYSVADALSHRGIPFVFASGYDAAAVPERYVKIPRCAKPVSQADLARLLISGSAICMGRSKLSA